MPNVIEVGRLWQVLSDPLLNLYMAVGNYGADFQVVTVNPFYNFLQSPLLHGIAVFYFIAL